MAEKKTKDVAKEEVKETPKKKSTTKKATAEKKPAAKKTTSEKKTTSKKATTEKKAPAKKKTAKKSEKAAELEALVKELPGEEIPLNVNPEDDEKIPLDPKTGLDPEKLETELNDLKDLVQGEIDKMMEENPDAKWKDVVKEARDGKKKPKKTDVKYCECCGEVELISEDQIYCSECLETMRHYPFEWWKLIIPFVTIALIVLCFSYFAISFSVFKNTVSANKLVSAGKLNSALTAFDSINAEIKVTDENFGNRYLKYQIDLYETLGIDSYEDLSDFIDKYYAGTKIDKWYNKDVKATKEKITSYEKLYDCFSNAYGDSSDYETFIENFDKAIAGKGYNEAQAYYYKYYAANVYDEDLSVMRENAEKIREVDPEFKSLYLPLLAEISLNEGNYDEMIKYADELKTVNSENPFVYLYKSIGYRLKGDITNAYNICNKGLEIDSTNSLLNYQAAIIALLQGKTELSYAYASTAYQYADTVNAYVSAANIYSLTAQLMEEDSVNDAILDEVSTYGYSLSKDVEKIINGEITIEDIFTTGKGDFSWE